MRGGAIIQKYKDKYAVEEDVFGSDLVRTINTMVPNYDESKVKLERPRKTSKKICPTEIEEAEYIEEITAHKTIGNTEYHFAVYKSEDNPDICLVTSHTGQVLVFEKQGKKWTSMPSVSRTVLKRQDEFIEHIEVLYSL